MYICICVYVSMKTTYDAYHITYVYIIIYLSRGILYGLVLRSFYLDRNIVENVNKLTLLVYFIK